MEIHERIRAARKEKKITQEKLAAMLKTSQSLIWRYEQGSVQMTLPVFKNWCEVLNVSADEVLELKIQK